MLIPVSFYVDQLVELHDVMIVAFLGTDYYNECDLTFRLNPMCQILRRTVIVNKNDVRFASSKPIFRLSDYASGGIENTEMEHAIVQVVFAIMLHDYCIFSYRSCLQCLCDYQSVAYSQDLFTTYSVLRV